MSMTDEIDSIQLYADNIQNKKEMLTKSQIKILHTIYEKLLLISKELDERPSTPQPPKVK